jgi:hypothetical protein
MNCVEREQLKQQLTSEKARADKAEADRDELIEYCEGIINFHKKYDDLCFKQTGQFAVKWLNLMTAAIKKIKGEL